MNNELERLTRHINYFLLETAENEIKLMRQENKVTEGLFSDSEISFQKGKKAALKDVIEFIDDLIAGSEIDSKLDEMIILAETAIKILDDEKRN